MEISKIEIKSNYKLSNLLYDISNGTLRIPRFQRKFVWGRKKIIDLLDSIYREYPIGSFFVWDADRQYNLFYKDFPELNLPKPDGHSDLRYILDGQQRATALFVTFNGLTVDTINYGNICFNFDDEVFFEEETKDNHFASVRDIFSQETSLEIFKNLTDERKKIFQKLTGIFANYPLSVISVKEKELADAIEIFERINQGGKKLSVFDLVVASTWGDDFDIREKYEALSKSINDKKSFGEIPIEPVLLAIALIIKGYCNQKYLFELKKEEIKSAWPKVCQSVEKAVDHLTANLGVKTYEFLPYPAILSLLIYLYYKYPKASFNQNVTKKVQEWFWKASLSERYGSQRDTHMWEDRKDIFDSFIEGKDNVEINYPITLTPEEIIETKITTKSSLRNVFFCLLASKSPKHFKNNNNIILDDSICASINLAERHHIFPKEFLKSRSKGIKYSEYSIANFCFIPAELNKEISKQAPSDYFSTYSKENPNFGETLKVQMIPYSQAVENNRYEQFILERANYIFEEFKKVTGGRIMQLLSNDPKKAIDMIEVRLRDTIQTALSVNQGYWNTSIPEDTKVNVSIKIASELKRNPYKNLTDFSTRDYLNYCDVGDYQKIILKNWNLFEAIFGSKEELQKRLTDLREYRNDIAHAKDSDPLIRKDGESAIEWFDRIFSRLEKSKQPVEIVQKDHIPEKKVFRVAKSIDKDYDTIICATKNDGLSRAFIEQHAWWAVKLSPEAKKKLKYLALYEVAPNKVIRWMGKIKNIEPYEKTGKFKLFLSDIYQINPIHLDNPRINLQSPRYTKYELLQSAKKISEIF